MNDEINQAIKRGAILNDVTLSTEEVTPTEAVAEPTQVEPETVEEAIPAVEEVIPAIEEIVEKPIPATNAPGFMVQDGQIVRDNHLGVQL